MTAPPRGPRWLTWIARLVPAGEREDWVAEWRGELEAMRRRGTPRLGRLGFALGSVPHAWSLRRGGTPSPTAGWGDLRYAARFLARRPVFTGVAAATLALGISVNAALFSLVNALLLRPSPGIVEPARLVQLARSYDSAPRWDNFSQPAVASMAEAEELFDGVAGYSTRAFVLGEGLDAAVLPGALVTGNWFEVLGVRPSAGRLLQEADDRPGAPPVVVLSHDVWVRRFASDPAVVGRTVRLGGETREVVGVAPPGFRGVDKLSQAPDLYLPTEAFAIPAVEGLVPRTEWGLSWLSVVARLRTGVDAEAARAGLDAVSMRLREASTQNEDIRVLLSEGAGLSPEERAETLRVVTLMGIVATLVLLLTCANVAGLFLARSVDRQPEFALRRTLGAGGGRIARQLLTESVLLAGLATLLAIPLTRAAGRVLPGLLPAPLAVPVEVDPRVYLVLLALGVGTGLLFGGGPAVVAARFGPARGIAAARSTGSRTTHRLRGALVVGQLALSLGLLTGAGVLARSVRSALSARPGLDPTGVLTAALELHLTGRYEDARSRADFVQRLVDGLASAPGVESAAAASIAPFWGGFARMSRLPLDGDPDGFVEADAVFADPAWFRLLAIAPVEGRLYDPDVDTEPVAVVNERFARRYWPEGGAVGAYLEGRTPIRIVGVVPDVRFRSLRAAPNPAVYEPLDGALEGRVMLHLRARPGVDAADLVPLLRETVAALDPGLPVSRVVPLRDAMAATLGETRTLGRVVAGFAALALLLASLGLYASVSYAVSRRTRDLAVRVAVGAHPGALFAGVVRRGLGVAVLGVGVGLGVAWLLGRALAGSLYGVGALDPWTLAGAGLLQVAVAGVAAAVPARRATRLDPARSLREDA